MRCDVIAEGIIAAAQELNLKTPIIARLQVSPSPSFTLVGSAQDNLMKGFVGIECDWLDFRRERTSMKPKSSLQVRE